LCHITIVQRAARRIAISNNKTGNGTFSNDAIRISKRQLFDEKNQSQDFVAKRKLRREIIKIVSSNFQDKRKVSVCIKIFERKSLITLEK
jgi:hypothetical protein